MCRCEPASTPISPNREMSNREIHMEAAWQKIQSLASIPCTVERQRLDRQSQQPFHAVAQIKKKGSCLWSTYRVQVHTGPLRVVKEKGKKGGPRSCSRLIFRPARQR